MTYTVSGNTYDIITDGIYDPATSSIKSYKYVPVENNVTYTKTINKDGLISNIATSTTTNVNKSYTFDSRLNITGISGVGSSDSALSSYDFNSRITNYNYGSGINNSAYNYNTSGDRTSTVLNSTTTTYTSSSTSHRLTGLSGGVVDTLGYNNAGRMSAYLDSTNSYSYIVNSLGQRVKKIDNNNPSNNINFVYDAAGQLIAEYDDSDNLLNEYIYLNEVPIALIRNSNLYFIYPDHLGTPRTITDISNNKVWTWENTEPFGNSTPNETVSGSIFKFNLRLPGQYFDNESNLSYNYFRDYNSMLGRYIQSDPIGLQGGINTYGYGFSNSLLFLDTEGLLSRIIVVNPGIIGYGHAALEINGNVYGLYPTSNQKNTPPNLTNMTWSRGKVDKAETTDFINYYTKQKKEEIHAYTLNLSNQEEKDLSSYLESIHINGGINYSVIPIAGENCVTFVGKSLERVSSLQKELKVPSIAPGEFIRNLNSGMFLSKRIIKYEVYK